MVTAIILLFVAIVMLLAAVLSVLRARRLEQVAKVNERLEAIAFLSEDDASRTDEQGNPMQALERWLHRVGFQLKPSAALSLLGLVFASGWVVMQVWGWVGAWLWWSIAATLGVFVPQVRYKQKLNKLIGQIPLFIDQVIRGLVTGRNVEGAIKLAAEDLQEPLRGLIDRAQRNVDLGADLGESLREAANYYDVKELHMLALAIHTSRVYGGSPREMLESVVSLIRQREQMQRELRAMTGETRVSAWVLGVMPSAIAAYMVSMSPEYIKTMWNDPSGQNLLMISAGLQALGGLILWRMVKSI